MSRKTKAVQLVGKAAFDVGVGFLLALVAMPVIIVCALGSAITLRAWPFFVQRRVGYRGRRFNFVKIRTLSPSTPVATDKYSLGELPVSRFGAFLRGTHLDELPQLLLVPIGKMSLVGPRPEMPELLERYPEEFVDLRTSVRPGCTGLWQISVDVSKMIYEVPEYDVYYVQNASPRFDLWILWRTLLQLVGRGSVTMADVPAWTSRSGSPSLVEMRPVADDSQQEFELRKVSNGS